MYSNQPSFFSKKRVNEGVAFYSAVITDLYYVWSHMTTIASSEALCHFGGLAALAGYHLNEIQKEKRDLLPPSNDPNPPQP